MSRYIAKPNEEGFKEDIHSDVYSNIDINNEDNITEYRYRAGMVVSDWDVDVNEDLVNDHILVSLSENRINNLLRKEPEDYKTYVMPIGKVMSVTEENEYMDEELVFESIEHDIYDLFSKETHTKDINVKIEKQKEVKPKLFSPNDDIPQASFETREVIEKVGEIKYDIEGHISKEYFDFVEMERI